MMYPRISRLKSAADFQARVDELGIKISFDEQLQPAESSPLGQPLDSEIKTIGNRFTILPMEGWDGTNDGKPTDLTRRRWKNFGISGAKLIWGGEAVAVRHDGRANPNQLLINEDNLGEIGQLRNLLINSHTERFGSSNDLLVGLQLTHSGRFARPNEKTKLEPRIVQSLPLLEKRFGIEPSATLLSDDELFQLIDDFVQAAILAEQVGFEFVDIKQCHGYLGHELLSAHDRPGQFGGSFENRTRFMRNIVGGIQSETRLSVATRLSIFDFCPFTSGSEGTGIPEQTNDYRFAFGGDGTGQGIDLTEPARLLDLLQSMGVRMVCTTAGSPYYNPHIQRPAIFPPSDGYQPPEDPLVGVARQIQATAEIKQACPQMLIVGSAFSYLQEWLPHVGQRLVRDGMMDSIGLGRMVLSYPELPADVLAGEPMARKKICRTFSDCTTAPRNGLRSGCYPLDPVYKDSPEHIQLKAAKKQG